MAGFLNSKSGKKDAVVRHSRTGRSHADTGSLAANSSEGKAGKEQECTVISTALKGSGIYRASALILFHSWTQFFVLCYPERM